MAKKLTFLLLAMCLMMSACGSNNANYDLLVEKYEELKAEYIDLKDEHESLINDYEDLWNECETLRSGGNTDYSGSSDADDYYDDDVYDDSYEDEYYDESQDNETETLDLQSYSQLYSSYDPQTYALESYEDFTITYDNSFLTVMECWGADPSAYVWEHKVLDSPQAWIHVRCGKWEDCYNSTDYTEYSRYGSVHDPREVYEATPLSINGYDGYCWTTLLGAAHDDSWSNDIYTYVIQIDEDHYLHVESSRMTLDGCCTFEELLTHLIHNITIP